MNPWLRESYLTNAAGKTYYIKIPKEGFFKMNKIEEVVSDSTSLK
jgi:hypothetical protein